MSAEKKDTSPKVLIQETELERLKRNMYMSDKEKLQAFTRMLRNNALLKKAKITHKP